MITIAIPIYRSQIEAFPGLPVRSVKKVSKKSPNTDFVVFLNLCLVISDFFDTFLKLRAGTPGNTFLRLFGDFGPRAPRDSCIWGLQSQIFDGCATSNLRIAARSLADNSHEGETHKPSKKNIHPNKITVCTIISEQTASPPFPLKISRKQAERVCANCFCKLFLRTAFFYNEWVAFP